MALTPPVQERSVDPFSNNRFSSTINRLSRTITNGENLILFPEESFNIDGMDAGDSTADYKAVYIDHGLAIKDDVLIHITEDNYELDFSETESYVDTDGGAMDQAGWYYVVLSYNYSRRFPAPKAYYMVIKDVSTYYNSDDFIFLAAVQVIYNSTTGRYEISRAEDSIVYYDPTNTDVVRPVRDVSLYCIDGGVVT